MKEEFEAWFIAMVQPNDNRFELPVDVRSSVTKFIGHSMTPWEWKEFWKFLRTKSMPCIDNRVYRMRLLG